MNRDPGREPVKKRLEALGFQVADIPEHPTELRPDFRATKQDVSMLVEVKTRTEDSELRAKMESVGLGNTESVLTPLDKHNSLSSDVQQANEQLKKIATADEFRVLWFRADNGLFAQDACQQIGATLFGIKQVFVNRAGQQIVLPCVYAGYADFFRYTDIDGVITEVDGGLTLLPNPFSPRKDAFSQSPIAAAVSPAILDLQRNEREGLCYVVDANINRKSESEVLDYLRKKHPAHEFLKFGIHTASTVVTTIDAGGLVSADPLAIDAVIKLDIVKSSRKSRQQLKKGDV